MGPATGARLEDIDITDMLDTAALDEFFGVCAIVLCTESRLGNPLHSRMHSRAAQGVRAVYYRVRAATLSCKCMPPACVLVGLHKSGAAQAHG